MKRERRGEDDVLEIERTKQQRQTESEARQGSSGGTSERVLAVLQHQSCSAVYTVLLFAPPSVTLVQPLPDPLDFLRATRLSLLLAPIAFAHFDGSPIDCEIHHDIALGTGNTLAIEDRAWESSSLSFEQPQVVATLPVPKLHLLRSRSSGCEPAATSDASQISQRTSQSTMSLVCEIDRDFVRALTRQTPTVTHDIGRIARPSAHRPQKPGISTQTPSTLNSRLQIHHTLHRFMGGEPRPLSSRTGGLRRLELVVSSPSPVGAGSVLLADTSRPSLRWTQQHSWRIQPRSGWHC